MALIEQAGPEVRDPPHHVCVAALATGVACMFAAVPVVMWLVNASFHALH